MTDPILILCLINSTGLIGASWYFYKKTKTLEEQLKKSNPSRRKRAR